MRSSAVGRHMAIHPTNRLAPPRRVAYGTLAETALAGCVFAFAVAAGGEPVGQELSAGGTGSAGGGGAIVTGPDQSVRPERLVVATFEEQGVASGLGDIVADILTQSINTVGVQLVERRQVRRVLDEQIIATSDLTQPGEAVRYGKLAESRLVLLGTVYRVDGLYVVSARIVDVESGIVREDGRAVAQFRTVDEMLAQIPVLVRALGLCDNCPSAPLQTPRTPAEDTAIGTTPTVRDYLERLGRPSGGRVAMCSVGGKRTLKVGEELQVQVTSDTGGYLTLLVVDASGAVSMLVPNAAVASMPIRAHSTVTVPTDAGFKLRVRPPLGTTRLKAIVSREPMAVVGSPEAAGLLHRVGLSQSMGTTEGAADPTAQSDWISAELELLVVSADAPPVAAASPEEWPIENAPALIAMAVDAARLDALALTPSQRSHLRWPLRSPFEGGVDVGCKEPRSATAGDLKVAVIDADFDPDDPVLATALNTLEPSVREQLRQEIRRNGSPDLRHGNRVASLIAGEAPWIPAASPGTALLPIRVTSTLDGPAYRVDRGGANEVIAALRHARSRGCRVINLSLSVTLEGAELEEFIKDPVWDELEGAGILVVCAAGNSGDNLDSAPSFPACIERRNIMCVGAVGLDGTPAKWSGGGSCTGAIAVDIMAPGVFMCVSDGAGRIGLGHGTSYAAAIVTGVAANLMQRDPALTPDQVILRLMQGAERNPRIAGTCRSGVVQCAP
jgi:hypothetical protein